MSPSPEGSNTSIGPPGEDTTELQEGYADVGDDVRLHYVEAGDGPLVVLLHGFPEFCTAGDGNIARRSLRPASASSRPIYAATTCRRSRTGPRLTPPASWPPTCAI